jgi:maltooligosyltrehalose trehalohydrolase
LEIINGPTYPMTRSDDGWFAVTAPHVAGTRYRYRLPDGLAVPDPASRRQDGDIDDPSVVVDTSTFRWRQSAWQGRPFHEAVIYELHVGTCGGFTGVTRLLPYLQQLGITAVELMPIADFPGGRNWGYDGVLPYAPDAAYGTPEDLNALIDTAHGLSMMVFLDVVYNHFGPDGNYLHAYASRFFNEGVHTPWGAAIDFRLPEVKDFFIENALYWLTDYRFDGLRFDAVHEITPASFLDEMASAIRAALPGRHVHLVLEHEGNKVSHLAGDFDAQWADDFHHCVHVLLTGESEGYYEDFQQPAALLARCLAEGFAYQGEISPHRGVPRGEPSGDLPTTAFVVCLQNHDQIGNRAFGERLTVLADPQALHAAAALLLLSPFVPLVFMGEEWGSQVPYLFFTSHNDTLAEAVRAGRRDEFKRFAAFQDPARREKIPDPNAVTTFEQSCLDFGGLRTPEEAGTLRFYRDLLAVRHRAVAPRIPGTRTVDARPLGPRAVRASWRMGDGAILTVASNFSPEAVEIEGCAGLVLHESRPGIAQGVGVGTLGPLATVAFLQEAPM